MHLAIRGAMGPHIRHPILSFAIMWERPQRGTCLIAPVRSTRGHKLIRILNTPKLFSNKTIKVIITCINYKAILKKYKNLRIFIIK